MDTDKRQAAREKRIQEIRAVRETARQKILADRAAQREATISTRRRVLDPLELARRDVLRPVEETPGLPRVLLIGDSISIGYTVAVRRLLEGKANVQRIPQSAGATVFGLPRLTDWLGSAPWDVIHFNFGLHDAMRTPMGEFRTSRQQYAENLRALVLQMKGTGATLIFATTTPTPKAMSDDCVFDDIASRNEVARQVMIQNGVAINDLYARVLPEFDQIAAPDDIHFLPHGYDVLAAAVAANVESRLND